MTTTYILPVYYAPYLINDDATGLSDNDKQLIDDFLSENEPGYCVDADVDNAYFSPRNDVDGWLGNDVCEFKFVKL